MTTLQRDTRPTYHASTAAYLATAAGRAYMARVNSTRWEPKPFLVIRSECDRDHKQRKFTGQGKALAVRHVESGRELPSAHAAARAFGVNSVTLLKYARTGQETRVGRFKFVEAA